MTRCWWLLFCFFLAASSDFPAYAQDNARGYFTAEIGSPLIGEPVDLLLTIDVPEGSTVTFPQFPREWPPFIVQATGDVGVNTNGGRTIYLQRLTVSLWRPGDYQTPEISIEYQLPNSPDKRQMVLESAYFVVKSVLNPDDLNLRPLKPPVAMFYISPLAVGAALAGLGLVGYFVWSRRKKFGFMKGEGQAGGFHVSARWVLEALKRVDSADLAAPKVYALVSDALRHYVQERFGVQAEGMTTAELAERLHGNQELSEKRQRELAYLLDQADLVKFARMQPPSKSADKMLIVAQRWVVAVEQEYPEAVE